MCPPRTGDRVKGIYSFSYVDIIIFTHSITKGAFSCIYYVTCKAVPTGSHHTTSITQDFVLTRHQLATSRRISSRILHFIPLRGVSESAVHGTVVPYRSSSPIVSAFLLNRMSRRQRPLPGATLILNNFLSFELLAWISRVLFRCRDDCFAS